MLKPIYAAHLLWPVEEKLIELLSGLGPSEWEARTIVAAWSVKNIAAHLLDTNLRKLSMVRDGYFADGPGGEETFVAFIDRINAEGVRQYSRLSGHLLIDLLEATSRQSAEYHQGLDPHARAVFAVSWAGEQESENWFDTARELTERWHHQEQIRLALGRESLTRHESHGAVLDCFMRALPWSYREVEAPRGTGVEVWVGPAQWHLVKDETWELTPEAATTPATRIEIPEAVAWRIFTKGIDRQEARQRSRIEGDPRFAVALFAALAIVG